MYTTVQPYCSVAVHTTPILSAMTRTSCGHDTQVGRVTQHIPAAMDGVGSEEQQLMQQEMGRLPLIPSQVGWVNSFKLYYLFNFGTQCGTTHIISIFMDV